MSDHAVLTVITSTNDDAPRMTEADLSHLIDEHRTVLFRYVRWLTFGDWQLAEDIVQETLLRAWQRPHALATSHASIRPWLFTVARNLVFDHRRARRVRPAEVFDDMTDTSLGATDEMDATLARYDMMRALDRLSARHRAVLIEVYYHRRSLAEIAEMLDVPLGTVKSRIYYALRALKVVVTELGIAVSGSDDGMPACDELARAS